MRSVLCDIGNTHFHFFEQGRVWKREPQKLKREWDQVFYISVNQYNEKKLLSLGGKCINLFPYLQLQTKYIGLGADRIAGCMAIEDGVVVDAGSAVTIDVMQKGEHLGGYILPGIASYLQMYGSISEVLRIPPDFSCGVSTLPQSTKEAIGGGILKSLVGLIADVSCGKKIYFSGGDGKFLSKFFENSIYNQMLVFLGMQKALKNYEKACCS